jgi:uncharacterized protein YdeI (YjbR/CyaY-like superfamily)
MQVKAKQAKAFLNQDAFRTWLAKHGASVPELFVRCYKVQHRARGITYREALDEALCAGWIDGVRHALDTVSFTVRFTPRRAGSAWSRVNIKRAHELLAEGRMRKAGEDAFAQREESSYSFESRLVELSPAFTRQLEANKGALRFFGEQPPWYQRTAAFWVMSAKREETREKRFRVLLSCSVAGEFVPPLRRPSSREGGGHLPDAT